ncbi:MAG: hypothetical protein IJG84_11630 [Kiritimatiellae bacterium]|nr:hypothetical protein [Kiritimatiellia bacterium]
MDEYEYGNPIPEKYRNRLFDWMGGAYSGCIEEQNAGLMGRDRHLVREGRRQNKQFAMRDGEILVIADSEETYRFEPIAPCELENPHVIPMRTWLKDFIECENRRASRDEDRIARVSFDGCELDGKMRIRWLNARVTWDHCYGPFGQLTTDKSIEVGRDIMNGTYGMHRHEFIRDDWEPNCCGDHGYRAFFTKDFDVLWSDDGRYDEPSTPYYNRIERVKWNASA